MARLSFLCLILVLSSARAAAQSGAIPWRTDPKTAVAEAQRLNQPLMVWVRDSSDDRGDDLERDQKRAFRDPRVLRRMARFVPLRLSQTLNRDVLDQFGLRQTSDLEVSFVAPDGALLGRVAGGDAAAPDVLIAQMSRAFQAFTARLFETSLHPQLRDKDASAADRQQALKTIATLRITAAEPAVLELLGGERVEPAVRKQAYAALAALSTKTSLESLVKLTRGGDAAAADALGDCTPVGAELLLAELKLDPPPFPYVIYRAVAKVCRIPKPKPEKFFDNAKPRLVEEELARITKLVQEAARTWKAENE